MKTIWKVLGAAAVVASLTPYKVHRDEETGERTIEALLWKVCTQPDETGKDQVAYVSVGLHFPEKAKTPEEKMFADDEMAPVAPMANPVVMSSDDPQPEETPAAPVAVEEPAAPVETAEPADTAETAETAESAAAPAVEQC